MSLDSDSPYVGKLKAELAEEKEKLPVVEKAVSQDEQLFVFFSFDLVESTRYKAQAASRWLLVTKQFYEIIEDQLVKRLPQVRLWKYVGDELLLYKRLRKLGDLRKLLPATYEVMHRAITHIYQEFPDTKTILSVKSTVWCAPVSELLPQDLEDAKKQVNTGRFRNISISRPGRENDEELDFLGPDIDTGFRIAKYAVRQRLIVGADLAYLLYRDRAENSDVERQLRIVALEVLKGVWNSRRYPIIWYENDWDTVPSSFLYDEEFQNDIVKQIAVHHAELRKLEFLPKIYSDLDLETHVERLWRQLCTKDQASSSTDPANVRRRAFQEIIEVHCAAVCFNKQGEVLLAQRLGTKKRFPNCWEFGCGQLATSEDFATCLRRNYKKDFNADLAFADNGPAVVTTYKIEDREDNIVIPGIIFVADVSNSVDEIIEKNHQAIQWVKVEAALTKPADQVVPDFANTLRRAKEIWLNTTGRR